MNNLKRKRSENWTNDEKSMLFECVKERVNVIENKTNTTQIYKAKKDAWMDIGKVMQTCGFDRDENRLKEQWKRMKMYAKTCVSAYKRSILNNEGPPPTMPSDIDWAISSLCLEDSMKDTSRSGSETNTQIPDEPEISHEEEHKIILDPTTGGLAYYELMDGQGSTSEPSCQSSQSDQPLYLPKTPSDSSKTMSGYEEEMLKLNEKKINLELKHKEEIHKKVMSILDIKFKNKQLKREILQKQLKKL